jgi:hypothetical protein
MFTLAYAPSIILGRNLLLSNTVRTVQRYAAVGRSAAFSTGPINVDVAVIEPQKEASRMLVFECSSGLG